MSYCTYVESIRQSEPDNPHIAYHDTQYGFPIEDDNELFGRLILEINQAGLSWTTILNKQHHFRKAYDGFNIDIIANYNEDDFNRLMADAGIIRNRLKINAAIHNARAIRSLQQEYGSFKQWIEHHHPKTKQEWVKIFKNTFRFTGGEIVNEFLMSTGYLQGAHNNGCPIYDEVQKNMGQYL
ncbi:DNA-3-methyladenine glycosylase I [soil metagenome]